MSDAGESTEIRNLSLGLTLTPGLGIDVARVLRDVAEAEKRIDKPQNANMMAKRKFWQTMKNMASSRELGKK